MNEEYYKKYIVSIGFVPIWNDNYDSKAFMQDERIKISKNRKTYISFYAEYLENKGIMHKFVIFEKLIKNNLDGLFFGFLIDGYNDNNKRFISFFRKELGVKYDFATNQPKNVMADLILIAPE